MTQSTKVWISSVPNEFTNNYYIEAGFPHIDYRQKLLLEIKRHNAQVVGSDVVFTEEDKAELKKMSDLDLQAWKGYSDYQGMHMLPNKLWITDINTPPKDQHVFTITGSALVVSEACGELLQQFRLGNTRLAKVQLYNLGETEPNDERFFYFVNISEWRHYLLPKKSGESCRYVGYQVNGYDRYSYQEYAEDSPVLSHNAQNCDLDLWHDPMLRSSIFISKDLYQALKTANMTESWFLDPCVVE